MLNLGLHLAGEKVPITFSASAAAGVGREQKVDAQLVKYHVLGKKIASSLGNRPYVDGLASTTPASSPMKRSAPGGKIRRACS